MIIVELVQQMCGKLTTAAPLIALGDHTNEDRIRRLRNGFWPKTGRSGPVISPRQATFFDRPGAYANQFIGAKGLDWHREVVIAAAARPWVASVSPGYADFLSSGL